MLRSHTCGELNKNHVGQTVTLCGWVRSLRDHKHFAFVDLADRYGWTQVYLNTEQITEAKKESFVKVVGEVKERPPEDVNTKINTGEIELTCQKIELIAACKQLPFEIFDEIDAREETRLKYRFLDIRRPIMLSRLEFRSKVARAIRNGFEDLNFLEVETPLLVRSTPEGSRDFVVPSRVHHGSFYALPQSPQLYKQMFMIAGIDRYYQFARCFRDEDARRERQLVHTQIDMEMALVRPEDVFTAVETAISRAFKETLDIELKTPFPRYSYDEVIPRWGIDKPDLRFGMELIDFSSDVAQSGFQIFENTVASGGVVKGIVAEGCAGYSRAQVAKLEKFAQTFQAKGLMAFKVKENLEGSLVKKMSPESVQAIKETSQAKEGDLILLTAGKPAIVHRALGELRNHLARELNLIPEGKHELLWVTDFPLFEWDENLESWAPMHHMFSMPRPEFVDNFEEDPAAVRGELYDLVLNGVELGSGSVRISLPEIQKRVMNLVGLDEAEAHRRFGFLLDAYHYAGPPHGGIGIGFDNLVMTMLGLDNIRDVIAYPNASNGMFLYDGSPGPLEIDQLDELHLQVKEKPKKEEENETS